MKRVDGIKNECLLDLVRSRRDGLGLHSDAYVMSDQQKLQLELLTKEEMRKHVLGLYLPLGPLK
jgi:hypothetical protein